MPEQCVREVVINLSTPLVFSTFESMSVVASLATTTFRWRAIGLSDCCYHDQYFSFVISWIK